MTVVLFLHVQRLLFFTQSPFWSSHSQNHKEDQQHCLDLCIVADHLGSWHLQAKVCFPRGVPLDRRLPPLVLDHLVGMWYADEFREPG